MAERTYNKGLRWWLRTWFSGKPHFIIGDRYLLRWYVIPRNPWLNVYLHKFLHDDEDRALHDHPWWFVSWMLSGHYFEVSRSNFIRRRRMSIAYRPATHAHRVVLPKTLSGDPIPCWTLVVTGPVIRDWGFLCPSGWRHWKEFTAADDYGQTGRGCD